MTENVGIFHSFCSPANVIGGEKCWELSDTFANAKEPKTKKTNLTFNAKSLPDHGRIRKPSLTR